MSTSVTINNSASMQPTYTALGMGDVPAGITADAAVTAVQTKLLSNIQAKWPKTWPDPLTDTDVGAMGPWDDNVAGTAPPCLVKKLQLDFTGWGLPVVQTVINQMAEEITEQVSSRGGLSGMFFGKTAVGGSETIYWAVGFGTGTLEDGPPAVLGIIYVFTAALGVN